MCCQWVIRADEGATASLPPAHQDADSRQRDKGLEEGETKSAGSDKSAESQIGSAAIGEAPGGQPAEPLVDKSEKRNYEVPTGKFWLHDDRTEEDANNR